MSPIRLLGALLCLQPRDEPESCSLCGGKGWRGHIDSGRMSRTTCVCKLLERQEVTR